MASKPFSAIEIVRSINNEAGEDIQRVAIAVLAAVVNGTPVGDPTLWQNPASAPPGYVGGHARRNWNVTIGTPADVIFGVAGRGGGEGQSKSAALSRGRRPIRRFDPKRDSRIIIQNAVPYIGRLNSGHSAQARPPMFVERAVQVGVQLGRNERKDLP